jgi:cutinase
MRLHRTLMSAAALTASVTLSTAAVGTVPLALAQTCSDVDVVFARGAWEPPGIGGVGNAFVDSLRSLKQDRSIDVYAVDYPATSMESAVDGARDASAYIRQMVGGCPQTRMVLGGYSLGALAISIVTGTPTPRFSLDQPLPPEVADHVAAVAIFANPSSPFSAAPSPTPQYAAKVIDFCIGGDPVCSSGLDLSAHGQYVQSGMTAEAAEFVASRI